MLVDWGTKGVKSGDKNARSLANVADLVANHSARICKQIDLREEDEVGRLEVEYRAQADRLAALESDLVKARAGRDSAKTKAEQAVAMTAVAKLEKQWAKVAGRILERNDRIAGARARAENDRQDLRVVGTELAALYVDPDELLFTCTRH